MPKLSMFQSDHAGKINETAEASRFSLDVAGHLLTDAAHDLRSPLAAARELTQLIVDGIDGPISADQKEHLEAVVARCDEMQRLIDDMLHYDCARTGTPRIFKNWLSVGDLPVLVQPLVASKLAQRSISLQWVGFEQELPAVFADLDKIKRVLVNLIANAIQVTPEAGTITVRTALARTNDRLRLTVEDAGIGIGSDEWSVLSHRGVSGQEGHGLGLSICRQIAAMHFTLLAVESRRGRGSRFGLELPVGGLSAVVDSFARWREAILPAHPTRIDLQPSLGQRVRPVRRRAASATQQTLPYDAIPPRYRYCTAMVSVIAAGVGETEPAVELDRFLQGQCGMHEFAYRFGSDRWMMLWDSNIAEAEGRIATIDQSRLQHFDSVVLDHPLHWSSPIALSVGSSADREKLQEAFVQSSCSITPKFQERDPLHDPSAQRRLENEVRWVTRKFRQRQQNLHRQAASLRSEK